VGAGRETRERRGKEGKKKGKKRGKRRRGRQKGEKEKCIYIYIYTLKNK
jgi:hypothetical protein